MLTGTTSKSNLSFNNSTQFNLLVVGKVEFAFFPKDDVDGYPISVRYTPICGKCWAWGQTHRTHTQSPGVLWIRSINHRNWDQTRNSLTDLTCETKQHHWYLFYPEDLTRILFQKFSNLQVFGGIPLPYFSLLISVPVLTTQLVNVQRENRASWNIDTHLEIWQLSPKLLGKTWSK